MAFTTLEDRYNQVSQQIYNRFSPSSDQPVVIKPNTNGIFGSKSRIKNDTRLLPLVSTARDVSRITRFLASTDGVSFLGKQTLLQTGNTFAETRLYNPLETLINTDPFLGRGTARHSVGFPVDVSGSKTPTRTLRGALQQETLDSFASSTGNSNLASRIGSQLRNIGSSILTAGKASPNPTTYFGDSPKEFYVRPEDIKLAYRITPPGRTTPESTQPSKGVNARLFSVDALSIRGDKRQPGQSPIVSDGTNEYNLNTQFEKYKKTLSTSGSATFRDLETRLQSNGYFDGSFVNLQGPFTENPNDATTFKKILRDPLNRFISSSTTPAIYGKISGDPTQQNVIQDNPYLNPTVGGKSDIIKFSFTTNLKDAEPVHFRAFLSSLKQNVKPEFNEQRYVGRTERFVTYGGVRRTVALQFNIAAFSQTEIDQAWARVNYLTGLAFPLGFSQSGFIIPPLFKLTVGGIYDNQPCYIDNLDFDFLDESITFDIDKEVSQVINVNMSLVLLEKRSMLYDSPFYKILEPATS
jgi:hypothetical protein